MSCLKICPPTMKALSDPDILTTSKWAAWNPLGPSEEVKQQAIAIQKLEAGLTGESLSNVKNVRNKLEFNTLGEEAVDGGPERSRGVQDAAERHQAERRSPTRRFMQRREEEFPTSTLAWLTVAYTSPTLNGKPNPYIPEATYEPGAGRAAGGQQPSGAGAQPATISGPTTSPSFRAWAALHQFRVAPSQGKIGYAQ